MNSKQYPSEVYVSRIMRNIRKNEFYVNDSIYKLLYYYN